MKIGDQVKVTKCKQDQRLVGHIGEVVAQVQSTIWTVQMHGGYKRNIRQSGLEVSNATT